MESKYIKVEIIDGDRGYKMVVRKGTTVEQALRIANVTEKYENIYINRKS